MKRNIWIGLAILLVLGITAALFNWKKSENPHELILYGNVDVRLVDLGFRVHGRVKSLQFEEGDLVPKGTLMATLEESPFDSELLQAEAAMHSTKAQFDNAEILLNRRKDLIKTQGVSQEDLDNAQASYNQLKASLAQAEAAVIVAQDNLSYTKLYAPTDGIILTRIREPGTAVLETEAVYTLSVKSPIWIRAFVSEPFLGKVYYGMPAEITTDTPGAPVYQGRVGFISPISEFTPKTVETTQLRTDLVYRLRIYTENIDNGLRQGMPVTVKLKVDQPRQEQPNERSPGKG